MLIGNIIILMLIGSLCVMLRGGALHNHLVCEAERILNDAGFETHQEYPLNLPCGEVDFVDLLAKKNGQVICVEVETSTRNLLSNIRKAEALELHLVVVVPSKKVLKSARSKLKAAGISLQKHRIKISLLAQLLEAVMNYLPLITLANSAGGKQVNK